MQVNSSQISLLIITTAAIIFLLAVVIVTLLYFYQKRQLAYQQNLNTLKLDFEKNLLKTQVEIQEQTFQHISREIHDHINHSLILAKLNLVTIDPGNIQKMSEAVKSSATILSSVITDLSNLSKSFHTEKIREMGLVKALNTEINNLANMTGLEINYEVKGEPVFLDAEKELVIFRIIQEAFNNIIKHSKATKIWLELNYSGHYLDVLVRDNGIGFDQDVCPQKGSNHSGLRNMETRAKIFKGSFVLYSRLEKGTQIMVSIPYRS